jgi:hypothetical protein
VAVNNDVHSAPQEFGFTVVAVVVRPKVRAAVAAVRLAADWAFADLALRFELQHPVANARCDVKPVAATWAHIHRVGVARLQADWTLKALGKFAGITGRAHDSALLGFGIDKRSQCLI